MNFLVYHDRILTLNCYCLISVQTAFGKSFQREFGNMKVYVKVYSLVLVMMCRYFGICIQTL